MDRLSNQEFFSKILASRILLPYMERDSDLAELTKSPDHPDIHYFTDSAPAKQLAPPLKRRLDVMVAKNISHNLEATKQLVAFMEAHPESQIYNVTFNCRTHHYGVRCGVAGDDLHVICVMTGEHIPNELLGEANS